MKAKIINFFIIALTITGMTGCVMTPEPTDIVIPDRLYQHNRENSLWEGETSINMLFVGNKARYRDDIITVLVEEESQAQGIANTKTSSESDVSMGIGSFLGMQTKNPRTMSSGSIGSETDNQFTGKGKTVRSGKLQAIISAKITDILPNGNFFLEGRREVKINSENQIMIISGIVRPLDISPDNTVMSRYIADARITYSGIGVLNDKQHPGWLLRILDWVWPL